MTLEPAPQFPERQQLGAASVKVVYEAERVILV
jgi:hypothetical protein